MDVFRRLVCATVVHFVRTASAQLTFQGIVPGAGDAVNAGLGYYLVIRKAKQAELSDNQLLLSIVPELIITTIHFPGRTSITYLASHLGCTTGCSVTRP